MFTNTTGKRIYVNADRSKAVEEGDPAAAFLLVGVDCEMPLAEAEKYGLTKAAAPADTKAVKKPPADKGR